MTTRKIEATNGENLFLLKLFMMYNNKQVNNLESYQFRKLPINHSRKISRNYQSH